jgi:hypothetical protein
MKNLNLSEDELMNWRDAMLHHVFDEEDWFNARATLISLLSEDEKKADENKLCSYISCCAEAVGNSSPYPLLNDVVIEFYNQYGMD